MLALLVKPAAYKKKSHRRAIEQLHKSGAHIITAHTRESICAEVKLLLANHNDLTVVACGGDGTVHLLANSVFGLPVTLAVLPMGTGNDFARYLGINSVKRGLRVLHDNSVAMLDMGTIVLDDTSQRHFVGISSCGFDAQVNERANRYRGPQGTAKYIAALLGEIRQLTHLTVDLHSDGAVRQRQVTLLALGNTSSYGGGMKVCPQADAQDGLFDVIEVAAVTRRLLLRVFPRVFRGTHITHPAVTVFRTSQMRIAGATFPIYADGERVGMGPATISISPQALRVKAKLTKD